MNHSGKFTIRLLILFGLMLGMPWVSFGQQPIAPSDQFTAPAPVMTFLDMNTGQPWGRYVVSETVTVPKYEYREVKERVWVPTWVQEPRATTATQYEQVVSYQLRPRAVPSWNPFTPPQQILEYVPIVQYQPRNVQAMQMTTYQKYEEREITRMVPTLVNASEQRAKFMDRPLSSPPSAGPMASNIVQESAMVAQASRTSARYPTRSIDYPSNAYGSPTYAWSAPQTLVPSPTTVANSGVPTTAVSYNYTASPQTTFTSPPAMGVPPSSIVVGNGVTYSSALVPVPSALVASNPTVLTQSPPNPQPNAYQPYAYPPYQPYAMAPYGSNPYAAPNASWMTSTGTLFTTNMFQNQSQGSASVPNMAMVPNSTVYASNAPNFWGRSAPTTLPPAWGTYPPTVNASGSTAYR